MFVCISLEGQMRGLCANVDPPPAEESFCYDSNCPVKPHIVVGVSGRLGVLTFLIMWPTVIQLVNIL